MTGGSVVTVVGNPNPGSRTLAVAELVARRVSESTARPRSWPSRRGSIGRYVDFEGRFFDVRGPSITPRPPQGHPIVAVDASIDEALPIAGSFADLVFVDALDPESAASRDP